MIKLSRQQKAANTKKAKSLALKMVKDWKVIKSQVISSASDGPINNLGSTMTLLEQAIDGLIQRINLQTQRIKDMM